MGKVFAADDVIHLDAIEEDAPLRDRLRGMRHGEAVMLDIGGFVGRWERVVEGAIDGVRAVGAAAEGWSTLRGRIVDIRPVGPNETHLATFEERLYRWDIPESRIYER